MHDTKAKDTDEIILLLKKGDSKIMQEVYASNFPKIKKYVLANSGNVDDAHDVFQEGFVAFWNQLRRKSELSFETTNHLNAFLIRIIKNKWIDQLRKAKIHVKDVELVADNSTMEEDEDNEEHLELVEQTLKNFENPCKKILKAFYFQKMSYAEMAKVMDYEPKVLKTMKYRCLNKLKNEITKLMAG